MNGDEPTRKAYLGRAEALEAAIEAKSDVIAPGWNVEDLVAVFARLRSVPLTDDSITEVAKEFENTSPEDLKALIESLRNLIFETDAERFQHKKFVPDPESVNQAYLCGSEAEAGQRLVDLVKTLSNKKKARGSTSERLKDVLRIFANEDRSTKKLPASSDIFSPAVEYTDEVNYSNIYKFLAEIAIFKKPKAPRPLESAIILNIFNEIQELADNYFDEHVDFFREMLKDVETMKYGDLCALQLNEDQLGKECWNLFNLPDDLIDLSAYVASGNTDEEQTPMDDQSERPSTSGT